LNPTDDPRANVSGPTSPHPTDAPQRAHRDWRENIRFIASVVNSLAIPLLTIAATAVGIYATNTLKEREIEIATENNAQALRNQREESETNLRSAMFRELVGPLLQSETETLAKGDQADLPRAQRLALLAELLALNFHEHFELGPLLRYVDTLPGQTEDARQRLRSTSRRVISRQLAPLLSSATSTSRTHPAFLELSLNSDATEPADKAISCALPEGLRRSGVRLACASMLEHGNGRTAADRLAGRPGQAPGQRARRELGRTDGRHLLGAARAKRRIADAHAANRVHALALLVPVL
jgi:hypothetical protein